MSIQRPLYCSFSNLTHKTAVLCNVLLYFPSALNCLPSALEAHRSHKPAQLTRRAVLTCLAACPALPVESNSLYGLTKHNCTGISCYHIGCYRQTELCEASTLKAATRTSTGPVIITLSPPSFTQVQSPHNQFHKWQPVSMCYIRQIKLVWSNISKVIRLNVVTFDPLWFRAGFFLSLVNKTVNWENKLFFLVYLKNKTQGCEHLEKIINAWPWLIVV